MTTVSNFHLTSVILSFLSPGSASLFVPGTRSLLPPVAGRGLSPSVMKIGPGTPTGSPGGKDRSYGFLADICGSGKIVFIFFQIGQAIPGALFRQAAIAPTIRSIGTGADPSTGRISAMAGKARPPRRAPPRADA